MALHPLAVQLDSVAGAYERGRSEYQPAVVERIVAELSIPQGAPVLDLAAGTGKLAAIIDAGETLAELPVHVLIGLSALA